MHMHGDILPLPAFQCNAMNKNKAEGINVIQSFKNERALKPTYRSTVELQDWALFLQHSPRLSAISFCNIILSWSSSSSTIGTWTLAVLLCLSFPLLFVFVVLVLFRVYAALFWLG